MFMKCSLLIKKKCKILLLAFHKNPIPRRNKFFSSGAAAPGFNSLIPAPSVPSLISTEPMELLCRASNISSTDPSCFVKQKRNQEAVEAFLQCFIYK